MLLLAGGMKPLQIVELEPIFAHERTELYHRTRELHAFAARLENDAGSTRYFGALTRTGLLAMLSTASAGVAATERARTRHLACLRDRLARFACTLRGMADRGLLEDDVLRSGNQVVERAEMLVATFDVDLRRVEADLLAARQDVEQARHGIGVANDEQPTASISDASSKATAGPASARTAKGVTLRSRAIDEPTIDPGSASEPAPNDHKGGRQERVRPAAARVR